MQSATKTDHPTPISPEGNGAPFSGRPRFTRLTISDILQAHLTNPAVGLNKGPARYLYTETPT